MSKVRRRLAAHFTLQFFFLWMFVLVTLVTVLLLVIRYLTNQDLKKTFPIGALDTIITETIENEGSVTVPSHWTDQLTERGYWLQVVDADGKVVRAINAPNRLPASYGTAELLQIEENGRFDSFRVGTKFSGEGSTPLLYMLGTEDRGPAKLEAWIRAYGEAGRVRQDALQELTRQLASENAYVQIIDASGAIVQAVGDSARTEPYRPLELIAMRAEPGLYPSDMSFYYDSASGYTWVLHKTKEGPPFASQPILHEVILTLVITGGVVLLLTFVFSVWHGYRYGQPLLLFVDWFERMGQGRYQEALTEKDRKKVFRKNGRIRLRYRLYKEVIAGFYEMAARLDASERERSRLEKTREEWMTGISHDLRTPLSTIQGYGHLLESGTFEWTEPELREMGRTIREKSDYMVGLLQDFSLTFQLKNNAVRFPLEDVELNEFVRRIVLRYVNDATIRHVSFSFECEERALAVRANPKWFQRMLDNLISNAVKHNPPGTLITVRTGSEGADAWIAVEDNGAGMDEETVRNLFDRYYRGTNTEEKTDGAGLGMSIAKAIATAHQGRIEVKSRVGKGTAVLVRFPLAERPEA